MQRSRLHVMGASGSGTTTLARALADRWSVPHADSDDYYWIPTDPPYTRPRPPQERATLMHTMFVAREAWVLSGSMAGWGDEVLARCEAVVFLSLDPRERLRRLEAREQLRDPWQTVDAEAREEFLSWARGYDDPGFTGRSRASHEG